MILSASRRTDIPNYYSEWFMNRIREGFLYVRNPLNNHQVSKINLSPELVDCIVFWTKNPLPMLNKLDDLRDYPYYFQFTLTGYGKDLEPNLPDKREKMIGIFRDLSLKTGKERVIWRYDPIIVTKRYTAEYHLRAFRTIAEALRGYTDKAVVSFVDLYAKTKKNMQGIPVIPFEQYGLEEFASELARIAGANGMEIAACAESMDLSACGIKRNSCIDKQLIERLIGCKISAQKDRNQRDECGCIESVEIGAYNTCRNGCRYCYANYSSGRVMETYGQYDPKSPILCGSISDQDRITERKLKSLKIEQMNIWDVYGS
ncbi:MAG: DUF1848 domain-containing protein [Lachnospiraceae bacterium]|nr:DUF1848 domain-containing protein [Lachnospiraceae bacterium]